MLDKYAPSKVTLKKKGARGQEGYYIRCIYLYGVLLIMKTDLVMRKQVLLHLVHCLRDQI